MSLDYINRYASQISFGKKTVVDKGPLNFLNWSLKKAANGSHALKVLSNAAGVRDTGLDIHAQVQFNGAIPNIYNANINMPKGDFYSFNQAKEIVKIEGQKPWGYLIKKLKDNGEMRLYSGYLKARRQHFEFNEIDRLLGEQTKIVEMMTRGDYDPQEIALLEKEYNDIGDLVNDYHSKLSKDQANKEMAAVVYKEHKDYFAENDHIFDGLAKHTLDIGVLIGQFTKEQAEYFNQVGGYASASRYFLDDLIDAGGDNLYTSNGKYNTFAGTSGSAKQRAGSLKAWKDPFYSTMMAQGEMMKAAGRHISYNRIYEAFQNNKELMGDFIREVETTPIPAGKGVMYPKANSANYIVFKNDGKVVTMKVNPAMKDALEIAFGFDDIGRFGKFVKKIASGTQKATTGWYQIFFPFTNLVIDTWPALVQSKSKFIPLVSGMKDFLQLTTRTASKETRTNWETFLTIGGRNATRARSLEFKANELFSQYEMNAIEANPLNRSLRKAWGHIENIMTFIPDYLEMANRFPEFDRLTKMGMPQAAAMERAKSVTGPWGNLGEFDKYGVGRWLVRATPYTNVGIQASAVALEALLDNRSYVGPDGGGKLSKDARPKRGEGGSGPNGGNWGSDKKSKYTGAENQYKKGGMNSSMKKYMFVTALLSFLELNTYFQMGRKLANTYLDEKEQDKLEKTINDLKNLNSYQLGNFSDIYHSDKHGVFKLRAAEQYNTIPSLLKMMYAEAELGADFSGKDWLDVATGPVPPALNVTSPTGVFNSYSTQIGQVFTLLQFKMKTFPKAAPVEPAYMDLANIPTEERYFPHTNQTAVALGQTAIAQKLKWSPLLIEALMKEAGTSYDMYTKYGFSLEDDQNPMSAAWDILSQAGDEKITSFGYGNAYLFVGREFDQFYTVKGELAHNIKTNAGKVDYGYQNDTVNNISQLLSDARKADYIKPISDKQRNIIYDMVQLINKGEFNAARRAYSKGMANPIIAKDIVRVATQIKQAEKREKENDARLETVGKTKAERQRLESTSE